MNRRVIRFAALVVVLWCAAPATAGAQAPAAAPDPEATPADRSKLWIVAGGAATTLRGDCQTCEEPGPYVHTGSVFGNVGRRINDRMDAGAEFVWTRAAPPSRAYIRSTLIAAVAQFRPWQTRGFFLKGGMGMTLVRNWVYDGSEQLPAVTSKALGLTYGAGWVFRRHSRAGLQIAGTQHVAALGDFETSAGPVENVVGNFWSIGAAVVIR
jgi:hypothetical protein